MKQKFTFFKYYFKGSLATSTILIGVFFLYLITPKIASYILLTSSEFYLNIENLNFFNSSFIFLKIYSIVCVSYNFSIPQLSNFLVISLFFTLLRIEGLLLIKKLTISNYLILAKKQFGFLIKFGLMGKALAFRIWNIMTV
jgi:hypothetical protein